ncbi:MAG: hypothetical protein O3A00_25860 [Planctomycetota bacterium]|nr:hypothetical protein [Planctomycetota bacterium]
MTANGKQDDFRIGFLATVELPKLGFVGGMLVTNHLGRPLEFQCTTPVKPNRSQEILYGPTLRPFVLSELIGKTLFERTSVKPHAVFVESPDALDLREHISVPVALCESSRAGTASEAPDSSVPLDSDSASKPQATQSKIRIGQQTLRFHHAHADDSTTIERHKTGVPDTADFCEPFERVREALNETLQAANRP